MCDILDASVASAIPFFAPPFCAFLAASVRGLTGLGDGVVFQTMWSIGVAMKLMPLQQCRILQKIVLYSSIMQCVTLPLQLYQARNALRKIVGYVVPMMACGSACVVLGAWLLLHGNYANLRIIVGILFLLFSVTQLALKGHAFLKLRHAHQTPAVVAAPIDSHALTQRKESLSIVGAASASSASAEGESHADTVAFSAKESAGVTNSTTISGSSSSSSDSSSSSVVISSAVLQISDAAPPDSAQEESAALLAEKVPAPASTDINPVAAVPSPSIIAPVEAMVSTNLPRARLDANGEQTPPARCTILGYTIPQVLPRDWFPPVSPKYSPEGMLLLLLPASAAGGLLGGLMGVGGPPLMIVYALLQLDKDILRGFGVEPAFFMAIRILLYTMDSQSVFDARPESQGGELGLYLSIATCAFCGSLLGTRSRAWVDSDTMMLTVLFLVFLGSGLLLGIFQDPIIALLYCIIAASASTLFILLYKYRNMWKRVCERR